jgi:Tfp pilus assembly protein PilN
MRAVNLLPRDEPRRRKAHMTIGTQLALVSPFVVISLIVAGYLLASSKVNDNKATLNALQQELAALPPPRTEPNTDAVLAAEKVQRITALASALQTRIAWDRILREISSVLPEDVWLTGLSAESPAAAAPAVPPPPPSTDTTSTDTTSTDTTATTTTPAPPPVPAVPTAPLNVNGYTYSQEGVARFLGRLAVIPELTNVKLVSSSQVEVAGREVFQFTITADVQGNAVA